MLVCCFGQKKLKGVYGYYSLIDVHYMLGITFETEEDKWKWGGILGGAGVVLLSAIAVIRNMYKKCSMGKASGKAVRELYSEKTNRVPAHTGGHNGSEVSMVGPSAPPYDEQL